MSEESIYLDYNATTPVAPEVSDAMEPYFREKFGNPSSDHPQGQEAQRGLEAARGEVARLLGAEPREIIFTGSGTESNNLAIRGSAASTGRDTRSIAISAVEHPAVEQPCRYLEERGADVWRIGVDGNGRVKLSELERALEEGVELVSIMHANNEMGAIQPVRRAAELAEEYGALVHADASQTVGKIEVKVGALGVDLLTVAGHKFYAPKGIGALYVREGMELDPVVRGASQERSLRPGTENVPGAVALGRASSYADEVLPERRDHMYELREQLWGHLRDGLDCVVRHGQPEKTLPNTLHVRFEGLRGDHVLDGAEVVAASTGSACHEGGELQPPSVLTKVGIDPEAALGAVRLSVGEMTTEDEIDRAGEALVRSARELASG